jgi:uncharacterized repeat protein (TIGR03806 family)
MKMFYVFIAALSLAACGGGGSSGGASNPQARCLEADTDQVNWGALATENLDKLSDYNLFASSCDPTRDSHGGMPYDLNTPLFSDYSSKYRFVFIPPGEKAQYDGQAVFDFPEGTVITKTFSMPQDTAFRGYSPDNDTEHLIETRLLIKRSAGWAALPYQWNEDGTEAFLKPTGDIVDSSVIHNGKQIDFRYSIPDMAQCKQCHSHTEGDTSIFIPIGPKARNLNGDFDYGEGPENQLLAWQAAGILEGLPPLASVPKVPVYTDADASHLSGYTDNELMTLAKGYLDVNCSHCHGDSGKAAYTGLKLEYWRDYATEQEAHGVCKGPIAYDQGTLSYDVVPGRADLSILHFRMDTTNNQDSMPRLGRAVIHEEGVALISEWINRLDPASCTP